MKATSIESIVNNFSEVTSIDDRVILAELFNLYFITLLDDYSKLTNALNDDDINSISAVKHKMIGATNTIGIEPILIFLSHDNEYLQANIVHLECLIDQYTTLFKLHLENV
ncbi:hypothetical protein AB4298_19250 [Shewanella sp. 10N.261.52.F9]|uniref:hypothetical protein n=1 Tax=Shewanella sp. 10N.261.52.F9 TaxID=3229684 RepID=UPI00354B5BA9